MKKIIQKSELQKSERSISTQVVLFLAPAPVHATRACSRFHAQQNLQDRSLRIKPVCTSYPSLPQPI